MKPWVFALSLLAAPAIAAPDVPPQDCTPFLTVQSASCEVTLFMRCESGLPGEHLEALFDADGLQSLNTSDDQGAWVHSRLLWEGSVETLHGTPRDPISMDELLQTGTDTFDFDLWHREGDESRILRVMGSDILTGETVIIDGVALRAVDVEHRIFESDGSTFYHSRGQQFLDPEARLWFVGSDSVIGDDGSVTRYDSTPVDFIFPGEPGFGETTPTTGCLPPEAEKPSGPAHLGTTQNK